MKSRHITAAVVGIVAVGGMGVVAAVSGGTLASYSSTVVSSPSTIGAARVTLGGGDDAGPELGYADLRPGVPQTVALTVAYEGSIDAAIGLSIAPAGPSAFCEQRGNQWTARPGMALTLRIGDQPEESYCSLYDGRVLALGIARPDADPLQVPVTVTLSDDATGESAGRELMDIASVHADGGFTDRATGHTDISTADADTLPPPPAGAPSFVEAALVLPGDAVAVALDTTDPAATARTASAEGGIALPAACLDAGIRPQDITEVIALDPVLPIWDATVRRGQGAGPFLVLGTAVADRITGSTGGDCIVGGGGDDIVSGGDGDDVLVGDAGADRLDGGAGADRLLGGSGLDDLRGDTGRDLLDGGPDAAICDATPDDDPVRCLAAPAPAPPPAAVAPAPEPPAEPASEPPAPIAPAPIAPAPEPPSAEPPPPAAPEAPAEEPADQPAAAAESATETTAASGTPEPDPAPEQASS